MGTRHYVEFIDKNGNTTQLYRQYDGYLDGAGTELLSILKENSIEELHACLSKITHVTEKFTDDLEREYQRYSSKFDMWLWKDGDAKERFMHDHPMVYASLSAGYCLWALGAKSGFVENRISDDAERPNANTFYAHGGYICKDELLLIEHYIHYYYTIDLQNEIFMCENCCDEEVFEFDLTELPSWNEWNSLIGEVAA